MSGAPSGPAALSGMAHFQQVLEGRRPLPSMATTVPMRLTAFAAGFAELEAIADDRHRNNAGGVHGGFAATVIDTVTGCAVHTQMAADDAYTTTALELKMVRPPPLGAPMRAEANVVHLGRRFAVANGALYDAEGRLLASGSATFMVFRGEGG